MSKLMCPRMRLTVIWLFLPTGSKSIQISIGRNRCPKVSMGWKAAGQKSLPLAHRSCAQHRHIPTIGLGAAIEISSRRIIEGKELVIWGGLGIIENAREETAEIISARAESADRFFAIEAQALARSKELMPAMPVRTVDVLYCNSLGK